VHLSHRLRRKNLRKTLSDRFQIDFRLFPLPTGTPGDRVVSVRKEPPVFTSAHVERHPGGFSPAATDCAPWYIQERYRCHILNLRKRRTMPLPTLEQFKANTKLDDSGHFFTSHRGSSIKRIDTLLKEFHKAKLVMDKMRITSALLGECAAWLKEKSGKESPSTKRRRIEIEKLAQAAFLMLRDTYRTASGEDRFNYNKSQNVGKFDQGLKHLHGGYNLERQLYVASSDKKSERVNPMGSATISENQLAMSKRKWLMDEVKGGQAEMELLANLCDSKMDWHTMTLHQAQMLSKIVKAYEFGNTQQVEFLHKKARTKLLVTYRGKRYDFENEIGKAYDTSKAEHGRYMYSVDEYGNLFASPSGMSGKDMYWNHSSYNAGKAVLCAGMLTIKQGKLTYISTSSGHYKPKREHLHRLLTLFSEEGVDLSKTEIHVTTGAGKLQGHSSIQQMSALKFLENMNHTGTEQEVLDD
jgi:hypothetical protein